jgi:hypothetical protein
VALCGETAKLEVKLLQLGAETNVHVRSLCDAHVATCVERRERTCTFVSAPGCGDLSGARNATLEAWPETCQSPKARWNCAC